MVPDTSTGKTDVKMIHKTRKKERHERLPKVLRRLDVSNLCLTSISVKGSMLVELEDWPLYGWLGLAGK